MGLAWIKPSSKYIVFGEGTDSLISILLKMFIIYNLNQGVVKLVFLFVSDST